MLLSVYSEIYLLLKEVTPEEKEMLKAFLAFRALDWFLSNMVGTQMAFHGVVDIF